MKLGLFGLLIVMGLGAFMGYVGHDTLRGAGEAVSHKVAEVRK